MIEKQGSPGNFEQHHISSITLAAGKCLAPDLINQLVSRILNSFPGNIAAAPHPGEGNLIVVAPCVYYALRIIRGISDFSNTFVAVQHLKA